MQAILVLLGRILLALIFILSGLSKIGAFSTTVAYMESKGIPLPSFFLYVAVLVEIAGGICVATGFRARLGALILFFFMVPTTFLFHFKGAFDPAFNLTNQAEFIQVLKNLSIMGGLLMVFGNGAGKYTIGKDTHR